MSGRRTTCRSAVQGMMALVVMVQLSAWAAAEKAGTILRPSALAVRASGNLVVLDPVRGLFELSPDARVIRPVVQDFGGFRAIDFAVASIGRKEGFFVSMVLQGSAIQQQAPVRETSKLVQIGADGRLAAEWPMPAGKVLPAGVAVDPEKQVAYIANARLPEILMVDLRKPGSHSQSLAYLRGAGALGPLTLDRRRQRLYVADVTVGSVYAVDVRLRRGELFAKIPGEPSALAFDPASGRLFVANAAAGAVHVISTSAQSPKPITLAEKAGFREPRGLALAPAGSVWVGDSEAGAIFLVSKTGEVLRTLRTYAGSPQAMRE